MKIWTAVVTVVVLMMAGGTAHAEGVSKEDIRCGNNPECPVENQERHRS